MGLTRDGRLVMWRMNRAIAVPPPQVNVGMKYLAAVLLGGILRRGQTLVPMATGQPRKRKS